MFFIAWLIKSLMIRYGGITAYRRTIPFFFGLIVGQLVAVVVACVLNSVWGFGVFAMA